MVITYEGRPYEFDLDDLTVKQALKIEKHLGAPLLEFEKGLAAGNTAAIQALGWLILHGGDQTPIAEVDFKVGRLMKAFEEASQAEAAAREAADGPDPTAAAASNGRTSVPAS